MSGGFDAAPAAAILAEAWHSGARLTQLPPAIRPQTLAQGYDIQDRLVAALGRPVVGWKLGMGSTVQKRQSGVGRSIAGRILGSHLYHDGDKVLLPNAAPVTVECEVAYILGRDVHPDGPAFPVMDAVYEVRVAFELVLSRFTDRRAVGWPSFAADNAGFQALILGARIDADQVPELVRSLAVSIDGQQTARSLSGEDATDPKAALADLVATARERGMVLPRGSIVSTGTVSKPFDVAAASARISACYLGIELGFTTKVG